MESTRTLGTREVGRRFYPLYRVGRGANGTTTGHGWYYYRLKG